MEMKKLIEAKEIILQAIEVLCRYLSLFFEIFSVFDLNGTEIDKEVEITIDGNDTYEEVQSVTPDADLFLHKEAAALAEGTISNRTNSTDDDIDAIDIDFDILNDPEAELDIEASG